MTAAAEILAEIRAVGAVAYRRGDEVRMRPARAITPALLDRVRRHKREPLAVLPSTPPEVAALPVAPAPTEHATWIVSNSSDGAVRLVVASDPGERTPAVYRAAALVETLDQLHRAGDPRAQAVADELEGVLAEIRRERVPAWFTS